MPKITEEQKSQLKDFLSTLNTELKMDETESMLENYLQIKYLIEIHEDLREVIKLLKNREEYRRD